MIDRSPQALLQLEAKRELVRRRAKDSPPRNRARWVADTFTVDPDPWQRDLLQSNARNIIINCSRQSGKSTATSWLAAYTAVFDPGLILVVSASDRQAKELFEKIDTAVADIPWVTRTQDSASQLSLSNGSRIVSVPSNADTIRCYSAPRLVIEDEASRVSDDVYVAVRPMLAISNGRLVLLSTPHGKRGHFYRAWSEGSEWERFCVSCWDVPRMTKAFLAQERNELGDHWFRAEYECIFSEMVDGVFNHESIQAALDNTLQPLMGTRQRDIAETLADIAPLRLDRHEV